MYNSFSFSLYTYLASLPSFPAAKCLKNEVIINREIPLYQARIFPHVNPFLNVRSLSYLALLPGRSEHYAGMKQHRISGFLVPVVAAGWGS